jgi:hypothetical protein
MAQKAQQEEWTPVNPSYGGTKWTEEPSSDVKSSTIPTGRVEVKRGTDAPNSLNPTPSMEQYVEQYGRDAIQSGVATATDALQGFSARDAQGNWKVPDVFRNAPQMFSAPRSIAEGQSPGIGDALHRLTQPLQKVFSPDSQTQFEGLGELLSMAAMMKAGGVSPEAEPMAASASWEKPQMGTGMAPRPSLPTSAGAPQLAEGMPPPSGAPASAVRPPAQLPSGRLPATLDMSEPIAAHPPARPSLAEAPTPPLLTAGRIMTGPPSSADESLVTGFPSRKISVPVKGKQGFQVMHLNPTEHDTLLAQMAAHERAATRSAAEAETAPKPKPRPKPKGK